MPITMQFPSDWHHGASTSNSDDPETAFGGRANVEAALHTPESSVARIGILPNPVSYAPAATQFPGEGHANESVPPSEPLVGREIFCGLAHIPDDSVATNGAPLPFVATESS